MKLSLLALSALLLAGCAADTGDGDEETGSDEAALGYTDASTIQLYNANTKHLSQFKTPHFEGTDFRQLLAYMKQQKSLPDIITLSEVGTVVPGKYTSKSCQAFLDELDRIVKPAGARTKWSCIVAGGSTKGVDNANGGVAIVHRARFVPAAAKDPVGLYYWKDGNCTRQTAGSGWTALVQKFRDGNHTVAVASVHLPTAGDGTNATGDDCSGKNLDLVKKALAATNADVKVIAGDMNHGDATRHEGANGALVHDHWETTYSSNNYFQNAQNASNSSYRDAFFRDCAKGFAASSTAAYTPAQTQSISTCLSQEHWSIGTGGKLAPRIDWVLVAGAFSLTDAKTIPYAEANKAYRTVTGNQENPATRYSDHRAQALAIKY